MESHEDINMKLAEKVKALGNNNCLKVTIPSNDPIFFDIQGDQIRYKKGKNGEWKEASSVFIYLILFSDKYECEINTEHLTNPRTGMLESDEAVMDWFRYAVYVNGWHKQKIKIKTPNHIVEELEKYQWKGQL